MFIPDRANIQVQSLRLAVPAVTRMHEIMHLEGWTECACISDPDCAAIIVRATQTPWIAHELQSS